MRRYWLRVEGFGARCGPPAAASREELVALAEPRLAALVRSGATTIEVKSGYGFTVAAELAMLEAIAELTPRVGARIVATLLIHLAACGCDGAGWLMWSRCVGI